jgi:hypothetical protein
MDYPKSLPDVYLADGKFTDGTPDGTVQPSRDPAAWANAVTDSILDVQAWTGEAPAEADATQLKRAIDARIDAKVAAGAPDLAGYLHRDTADILTAGFYTTPVVLAAAGGAAQPDLDAGNVFVPAAALAADLTLNFPADVAGRAGMFLVELTQDATGGRNLTLASGYHLTGGAWSLEPDAVNILWITSDGGGAALDVVIGQRGA